MNEKKLVNEQNKCIFLTEICLLFPEETEMIQNIEKKPKISSFQRV